MSDINGREHFLNKCDMKCVCPDKVITKSIVIMIGSDHFMLNTIVLPFSHTPFRGLKSPWLPILFVGSLGLLLHRSNVSSYSKPPIPSSEAQSCQM